MSVPVKLVVAFLDLHVIVGIDVLAIDTDQPKVGLTA
jgi:hypothetical protein